ncbi:hypothetical protein, partial [Azoarcus taiwanensis]|uniref:hypothetical protein n=1 Tax=Azoarcus taiwanensis TaxID=666964 RepID=UPI001B7D12B2
LKAEGLGEALTYSPPLGLSLSKPWIFYGIPFDKALLSAGEGLRANGFDQCFLRPFFAATPANRPASV